MNYKMVLNVLGKVFLLEVILLALPMIVGFIYNESSYMEFYYFSKSTSLKNSIMNMNSLELFKCE